MAGTETPGHPEFGAESPSNHAKARRREALAHPLKKQDWGGAAVPHKQIRKAALSRFSHIPPLDTLP